MMIIASACTWTSKNDRNERLAGMYKLYMMENQDSTGTWHEDEWARGGNGWIIYDGLGHMAVQITPKDYRKFVWLKEEEAIDSGRRQERIDSMTMPELKAALAEFSSSYVYLANYSLDTAADIIQHDRISSDLPVIWDTRVRRAFTFSGDTLILRILNGNRRLKWIKQK